MRPLLRVLVSPCAARAAGLALCTAVALTPAPRCCVAQSPMAEKVPIETLIPPPATPNLDEGRLVVSLLGKPERVEDFVFQQVGRALVMQATSTVSAPGQNEHSGDKSMLLVMSAADYAVERYKSEWIMGADTLWRGAGFSPGDTVCTIWRESPVGGVGDRVAVPPGRIYMLDPPLYATFVAITWSLQGKVCERRPTKMLVLGARDSLVEGTVSEAATETIRWGGRPVVTRKLVISGEQTGFVAWVAPDGRLLRLEQPSAGLRVDREAPPVKKRTPRVH